VGDLSFGKTVTEIVAPYLSFFGFVLLALLTSMTKPGPGFARVVRITITRSRADGLANVLGIGMGVVGIVVLAMTGLQALIVLWPRTYTPLGVVCGLYLVSRGFSIWRGVRQLPGPRPVEDARDGMGAAFRRILAGHLGNPKLVAVYGCAFVALSPMQFPFLSQFLVLMSVLAMEVCWYFIIALVLLQRAASSLDAQKSCC
jgi:threonine/homoserine/homoserine lactone efflux protein